jgi:ATP-dependent exoDNAse (exonuclease V) beta subunit
MINQAEKPLQILNASAGSGKTYNLVKTYLKLILGDNRNPSTFAHIMAMTFTNKAALEMKTRIISALDSSSNPNRKTTEETKKALSLIEDICKDLKISKPELQFRAKNALKQILHQYEDFNVMTIDKFNLRLIRSFSRDLDLDSDFQIILNEDEVLDQVIDQLMDGLDPILRAKFTQLVLNYSREKITDQESWNFQRDLKKFANILTNEKYFTLLKEMKEADFSEVAFQSLKSEIELIKSKLSLKAKRIYDLFQPIAGNTNLPGKTVTVKAFEKLNSDDFFNGNTSNNGVFSNSLINNLDKPDFSPELRNLCIEFQEEFESKMQELNLLTLVKKNFYNMALLQFIADELETVKQTEKLIRISEFNKLISELIENEEAPFIYERLGTRFKHFLLDEFQDTSRLQWMNIVPLVHESLSQGQANLIVGDPKQSIYRFKNGLAEQFVALPAIYNPEGDATIRIKSDFFEDLGKKTPLKDNYRSFKEIVKFNNVFFETFKASIPSSLVSFYDDVAQNPMGKNGGYVFIHSEAIKSEGKKEDQVDDKRSVEMMLSWINQCIADGFDKGDICILGNTKKDCNSWAIELTNQGHKVVSADSLLVNSDHGVKMTIAYLKWRKNPAGELEARRFSELYFSLKSQNSISKIQSYWKTETNAAGKSSQFFDTKKFFTENFGSEDQFFFPFENLYNLLQGFYNLVSLEEIHNPYLHHLSDMVHEFDNQRGPELELFLDFYNGKGKDSAIQIPENKDAIKVMTGHKSKGLEFKVVLLPNMDWSITGKSSMFLMKESEKFVYAGLSKNSKVDRIRVEHEKEYNQSLLDKINLCYVMFTRPIERLYMANFHQEKPRDPRFGKILHEVFLNLADKNFENVSTLKIDGEKIDFECGEILKSAQKAESEKSSSEVNFSPISLRNKLWFPDISLKENALDEETGLTDQQRFGNQLHFLLSITSDITEIDFNLKSNLENGLIENAFETKLRATLQQIFGMKDYQELLQNATKILNEQGIIISQNETKRPDKIIFKENETIVIDYKTGIPKAQHLKQVQVYADTLREMGYQQVRGIVFYTSELRLVRAESV